MIEVVFRPSVTVCPECKALLRAYRTDRSTVKTAGGTFTAVHKLMICRENETVFRSELLRSIIAPGCTYANEVMTDAAVKRFIGGRSCSEISSELGNGISESHVRLLSSTALDIFRQIHEESYPVLRAAMNSYVLHIDGTTDGEFEMILVVRDSVSGFTLYAEKCHSESLDSVKEVLLKVKERFGTPSGALSDMRAGILKALSEVFPGIPVRICLFHFLRDLGRDLMHDMHTDLGMAINRIGIKSPLKSILRAIPDYSQSTLYEIEQGYCSGREEMEIMALRSMLDALLNTGGSSGYGFPFSLRHLSFYTACTETEKKLAALSAKFTGRESAALLNSIMGEIRRITGNTGINRIAAMLSDVNMLFGKLRDAFRIPDKGSLSDDLTDDDAIHAQCDIVTGGMEAYLSANIPRHMFTAAKHIIASYRARETMLFANNADHTIPRTNNMMEQFFRKVTRSITKRCGNIASGNILAQSGASLALFQNMSNEQYVKIVFGERDIPALFAKHRKPFRKPGMTKTRIQKLVSKGTEMIIAGELYDTPYHGKLMDIAYASRNTIVS